MGITNKIFDGLLVLQCQSGDRKAMTLLVNRYHLRLCKHAYRYTHNVDVSKDIVQDCWTIITKKIHKLNDPNSFGSWAMKNSNKKVVGLFKKDETTTGKFGCIL
ncbi:MAG: sigma factor [Cellulophaga sp.]